MKVMEIAFMALHALKAEADKMGLGNNHSVLLARAVNDLKTLPASYHEIEATKENEEAAAVGVQAAKAHSAQMLSQQAQLDAHTTGQGSLSVQRRVIDDYNRKALDAKLEEGQAAHADAVNKSRELAKDEEPVEAQRKRFEHEANAARVEAHNRNDYFARQERLANEARAKPLIPGSTAGYAVRQEPDYRDPAYSATGYAVRQEPDYRDPAYSATGYAVKKDAVEQGASGAVEAEAEEDFA